MYNKLTFNKTNKVDIDKYIKLAELAKNMFAPFGFKEEYPVKSTSKGTYCWIEHTYYTHKKSVY